MARAQCRVKAMSDFLTDFTDSSDSPDSALTDPKHQAALKLCDALIDGWHEAASRQARSGKQAPLKAYLLLETWADNPLAADLEAQYPVSARMRQAVPDELFQNREDQAPCLVPLPPALVPQTLGAKRVTSAAAATMREQLAHWLTLASQHARQRHVSQQLCGVILSSAEPEVIVRHWVDLGYQQHPAGSGARLFRYQDPRVMQRVWPHLSVHQKTRWLGPVAQWWALTQPWGPWAPDEFATGEAASPHAPDAWFCAGKPEPAPLDGPVPHTSLRALFTPTQWHAAHMTPDANRVWKGYAADHIAAHQQPDGATLARLLADAACLGLTGSNLQEYVWCTWRHAAPPGTPRQTLWTSAAGAAFLQHILTVLRQQPGTRFASVYAETLARQRA